MDHIAYPAYLLKLADDTLATVVAHFIYPAENVRSHIAYCTDLRCDVVDGMIHRTRTVRLVCRRLARVLRSSGLEFVCLRLSNAFSPMSYTDINPVLAFSKTLAIDIDVRYLSPTLVHTLGDILLHSKNLIRLSTTDRIPDISRKAYPAFADAITRLIRDNRDHSSLRALLLHVDFDSYHLLIREDAQATLTAAHLFSRRFPTTHLSGPVVWNELAALSIAIQRTSFEDEGPSILSLFSVDSHPSLRKLIIQGGDFTKSQLGPLFQAVKNTVTDLTVKLDSSFRTLPSFPSSTVLEKVIANHEHARSLLRGVYPSLSVIVLDGLDDSDICKTKAGLFDHFGTTASNHIDLCLWHIATEECSPNLQEVRLQTRLANILLNQGQNMRETVTYAYWGARLPNRGVCFLDVEDEHIMPNCWNLAYPRKPPVEI